jgi:hypothetical protein
MTIKSQKRANASLTWSLRFYRISGKGFVFFRAKMNLLGFSNDKITFLEIKYAYTIALTLGCLLAGS